MGLEVSPASTDGLEGPSEGSAEEPGGVDKVLEVFSAAMDELDGPS